MALLSSVTLETRSFRTSEHIDHCHPNPFVYKFLTSTDDEYESGFVRNQSNRNKELKSGHVAAERDHMYMMIKMRHLFAL